MSDIAIKVENLGKMYRIGEKQERYNTFRDTLNNIITAPFRRLRNIGKPAKPDELIWALKDVSFEVKHGEVIGIIGRNGAGKSTLLKILSQITEPTEGQVTIYGRVGSLLEVGTGFHPELTGRENIYLNGAILGMSKVEINRKFDEIVDFAEIEKFMDTQVKHYSSGMYMRLAFAVAAHLEPEILLVDEVLAVGDAAFQKKCLGKMEGVAKEGRTVLFVSHNIAAISSLCINTIILNSGRIMKEGKTEEVIESYVLSLTGSSKLSLRNRKDRVGSGKALIVDMYLINKEGQRLGEVMSGQKLGLVIKYESTSALRSAQFKISIYNYMGQLLLHFDSKILGKEINISLSDGSVECWIDHLPLTPGLYRANVSINNQLEIIDHINDAISFQVVSGDFYGTGRIPETLSGICLVQHIWSI